jgi:hypothetical protein
MCLCRCIRNHSKFDCYSPNSGHRSGVTPTAKYVKGCRTPAVTLTAVPGLGRQASDKPQGRKPRAGSARCQARLWGWWRHRVVEVGGCFESRGRCGRVAGLEDDHECVSGAAGVGAILAAGDMAAGRGRAAVLDGRHGLELAEARMIVVSHGSAPVSSEVRKPRHRQTRPIAAQSSLLAATNSRESG